MQIKFDPQEQVQTIEHIQTNNKVGSVHKAFLVSWYIKTMEGEMSMLFKLGT